MKKHKKLEYLIKYFPDGIVSVEDLNINGDDGWELTVMINNSAVFKREILEENNPVIGMETGNLNKGHNPLPEGHTAGTNTEIGMKALTENPIVGNICIGKTGSK